MKVSKSQLAKTLKAVAAFDSAGSPFVGVQRNPQGLAFHRTGPFGLIESKHWDREAGAMVVSLAHFRDTLSVFDSDEIIVEQDASGICRLSSDGPYSSEVRVHTQRNRLAWAQLHNTGVRRTEMPTDMFKGISLLGIPLSYPPILRMNKLMLATTAGIVVRDQVPSTAGNYPREALIRAIGGEEVSAIYKTSEGYWGAELGDLHILVAGHRMGDEVFDLYNVEAKPIAQIPASRFLFAVRAASGLAADGTQVRIDPKTGVHIQDQYSNPATFSLGQLDAFPAFSLQTRSAKVIGDALSQGSDEALVLGQMNRDTYRLSRGAWSVSFRVA